MSTLDGRRVVVTSGPTHGPIDAVRYIANTSTGELGCRIAEEALARSAEVELIYGPGSALPEPHARLRLTPVRTVDDVLRALERALTERGADAIIHAMAVLDYAPEAAVAEKIPSGRDHIDIRLARTPKVIDRLREWAPQALLVGFKLLSGADEAGLRAAAVKLMERCGADLVLANDLATIREGRHPGVLVGRQGEAYAHFATKAEIAAGLMDEVSRRLAAG